VTSHPASLDTIESEFDREPQYDGLGCVVVAATGRAIHLGGPAQLPQVLSIDVAYSV